MADRQGLQEAQLLVLGVRDHAVRARMADNWQRDKGASADGTARAWLATSDAAQVGQRPLVLTRHGFAWCGAGAQQGGLNMDLRKIRTAKELVLGALSTKAVSEAELDEIEKFLDKIEGGK